MDVRPLDPLKGLIAEQDDEHLLQLLKGQSRILEMMAEGALLAKVLEELMLLIERQTEGMLCSLLLLSDDGGHLQHCAAPSLPEGYTRAIDGTAIGPRAGSCGTAAYLRRQVIVTDIEHDPLWTDWKDLALLAGLRACWATPVFSRGGDVLGTFAMYYTQPTGPAPLHLHLIALAAHLAGIAIERERGALQRARMLEQQRALRRQLEAAQRLESLALLAGGIAHEFNNLLTVILNGLALVRDGPLSPTQLDDLDTSAEAARRGSELTRQLLALGRKQPLRRVPLDAVGRLRALENLLRKVLPETVSIEVDAPASLPLVLVDPRQLDQVLMNLCLNARDAMPGGGRLQLRASEETLPEDALGPPARARTGRFVCLAVVDTGPGIPAELRERVFEPFFTTKEPGTGSGLGLAVALGIVEQHGGTISCRSESGVGTTFVVHLPVHDGGSTPIESSGPRQTVPAEVEWLLVAEDEAPVRQMVQRVLERAGYRVVAVADGLAAIEEASRRRFDLVLLDGIMPRASGRESWERIRAARPDTRFLMMSGYSSDVFPTDWLERNGLRLVSKPFEPDDLLREVRALLRGS